ALRPDRPRPQPQCELSGRREASSSMVQAVRAERSPRGRVARVVAIAGVVVVLDQVGKLIVLDRLTPGLPVVVVEGLVALALVVLVDRSPSTSVWAVTVLTVELASAGARLDRWLSDRLTELSRARLQTLIRGGLVRVDGAVVKAAHRLRGGEGIEIEVPPAVEEELAPEPVALSVVYEDDHVLVVDKPAGMVVHPGAGRALGTLAAAILAHAPGTAGVGGRRRPGIV